MKKPFLPLFMVALFTAMASVLPAQTLMEAVIKSNAELALKLIKGGADPNLPDENGSSPLMTACRWDDIEMARLLLGNGAKTDEPRSPKGRTPLMITCAYYGGISVTRLLVEKGANVNASANDGTTALMLAAKYGKIEIIEYLISKGADALKADAAGLTALDYAIKAEITDDIKKPIKDCKVDKDATIARLKAVKK